MMTISIRDADGRDVMQPSAWLGVGREYHQSFRTPHCVSLVSGDGANGSVTVSTMADTPSAVRLDSLRVPAGFSRPVLAALIYSAFREGRIAGRSMAYIDCGEYDDEVRAILRVSPGRTKDGFIRQRVDYGLYRAFTECDVETQTTLASTFSAEVVRTVEEHLARFFSKGAWACRVRDGVLSREQYVATLFNLHSYVRYTTRLLGQCIGITADRRLRAHYIEHLRGEINHELIIERDLTNLGEDVAYVAEALQPPPSTMGFMSIQESIVAFHRDPVMFLACPISAESFAAYVQADILDGLKRSITSWRPDNPTDVLHFVKSHSGLDGGPDGHWNRCVKVLRSYVQTEPQMQRFSAVVHAAMSTLAASYDSCVLDYAAPAWYPAAELDAAPDPAGLQGFPNV